ncbi:hypothetical protein ACFL6X_08650 [Candidatus Latescibacterota bacterium]
MGPRVRRYRAMLLDAAHTRAVRVLYEADKVDEAVAWQAVNAILDLMPKPRSEPEYEPLDNKEISDGSGAVWSAWCPRCGCRSMRVVRPGEVQCQHCD